MVEAPGKKRKGKRNGGEEEVRGHSCKSRKREVEEEEQEEEGAKEGMDRRRRTTGKCWQIAEGCVKEEGRAEHRKDGGS